MTSSEGVAQAKSCPGEVLCNVQCREMVSPAASWSCWAVLEALPTKQGRVGMADEKSGGVS